MEANSLVLQYLPLASHICVRLWRWKKTNNEMFRSQLDYDDLYQVITMTLVKAARSYTTRTDPVNCTFLTYAYRRMKWAGMSAIRERRGVLSRPLQRKHEVLTSAHPDFQLLEPTYKGKRPEEEVEQKEQVEIVQRILRETKTARDKWILEEVYIHGRSVKEIAQERGVTRQLVWQWLHRAKDNIKKRLLVTSVG